MASSAANFENKGTETDINDVFDNIALSEDRCAQQGFIEGYKKGAIEGEIEGFHLGYHRGAELGAELGYYKGVVEASLANNKNKIGVLSEKVVGALTKVYELLEEFPETNSDEVDILALRESIRAKYKKACSLMKIDGSYPETNLHKLFSRHTVMTDHTSLQSKIMHIIEYLDSMLPLANCHTVDFITNHLWESLLPEELRIEVETMKIDTIYKVFKDCEENMSRSTSNSNTTLNELAETAPNLVNFITKARNMSLCSLNDLTLTHSELCNKLLLLESVSHSSIRMNQFMSHKKTHEVEVMSEVVASLAHICQLVHVVDVGSGKGYLSSILASHHKLNVLGIDSSQINSHGAAKRTEKLQRAGVTKKSSKTHQSKALSVESQDVPKVVDKQPNHEYKQATVFVTQQTDLVSLIEEHLPSTVACKHLALVGLHTCGDLASTALRLFSNNDQVLGLCNIGCCYHLINEKFSANPFKDKQEFSHMDVVDNGFPMSNFLELKQFSLGRNARMLAAQSLERITQNMCQAQKSTESLHQRALLQVLLVERCGQENLPEGQVGRLAAKCSNFSEYILKALKKLGVDIKVSQNEIEHLYVRHELDYEHLQIFFLLRICLAPVIEGLILLDRLLYLVEQDKCEAFLVKMFDPLVSPRCYGIVAIKHE